MPIKKKKRLPKSNYLSHKFTYTVQEIDGDFLFQVGFLNLFIILDYVIWHSICIEPQIPLGHTANISQWIQDESTLILMLKSLAICIECSGAGIFTVIVLCSIQWLHAPRRTEPWSRIPIFCSPPELRTQEFCTRQFATCVICIVSISNPSTW